MEPSRDLQQYVSELETLGGELPPSLQEARWLAAFRDARYEESLSLLDPILANEPANLLARLVWIRSHLAARQLPMSALCSPLEDLPLERLIAAGNSHEARYDTELRYLPRLAKALFLQSAFWLEQNGQARLAWSMIEKALSIPVEASGEELVREYARSLLDQEIERADSKRESALYKKQLQKARTELLAAQAAAQEKPTVTNTAVGAAASTGYTLTAKDIAESAPMAAPSVPTARAQSSSNWNFVFFSLCLLVIGAGAFHLITGAMQVEKKAAAPIQLAILEPASLVPPPFEISANRPVSKKLETVGRRLESLGTLEKKEAPTTPVPNRDEVDTAALDPANAKDLKLPITAENDEIVSIDGTSSDEENIPRYDPSRVASRAAQQVESVGESGRKIPIPAAALGNALEVDPKGRVFGPASTRDPASAGGQRVALDGSPLRSYEVEQFTPPQLFHTVTSTRVLSAPSILSSTLAELPENTPVHVSARMGQWLELRSTGGRVGYIFSQDAAITQ